MTSADPLENYEAKYLNKVRYGAKFYSIEGTEWMKSDICQVNRLYCEFEVVHKSVVPPEQIAGLNKEPQLKVSPYFNQSTTDNESAEAGEDGFSDQDSWDEIFNGKTLANSTAKNFDSPTVESVSEEIASGDNFSGSNNDGLNTAIIDLTTAEEPKD